MLALIRRRGRDHFLSEPLRMGHGRVEVIRRLVALEGTRPRRASGLRQEGSHRLGRQRPEGPSGMKRLFQDFDRVAAGDHDARGQVHRIVQALDRAHRLAGRDLTVPEGLHPGAPVLLVPEDRQDLLLEALEVGVHHVQRHLDRVEPEPVLRSRFEHPQMDRRTLVSREADVTDPPSVLRLEGRLDRPAVGEDPVRILHPDDLVELQEVDDVRLEPSERLPDLPGGSRPRLAVDLRHQEGSLSIAVPEGLSLADLAPPLIVVPGVVEEIDARVDRGADDADALRLREVRLAKVEPAEADRGDSLASAAEAAHRDRGLRLARAYGGSEGSCSRRRYLAHSLTPSADVPWTFPPAIHRTHETARPFVVWGRSPREIMIERANHVRNDSSRSPDVQPEGLPVLMEGQVDVRKPERHPGQSHNPQSDGQQNQSWLQQQHRVSDEPKQVSFPLNRHALGAVQVIRKSERVEEQSRIDQREDRHTDHGQGNLEKNRVNLTGSKARKQKEQEKRENRDTGPDKGHDTADIQIGSLVAHGGPSLAASTRTGALSLRPVARLPSLSKWSIGMRLHGFRPRSASYFPEFPG